MTKPLLCLVAIVKDEAKNIRATLESVKGLADRVRILDTGSTDGTPDIIREVMAGMPGQIYAEPFIDYAVSRNRILELAGEECVFTLMVSGDEVVTVTPEFRQYLESQRDASEGAYCVEMNNGSGKWLYPRILRTGAGWKYVGDIQEVPKGPKGESNGPTVPGITITFSESDPVRKLKRLREYDLPRLEKRVSENANAADQDELAQAIWFLAQTHEALAQAHPPKVPGGEWMKHMLLAMSLYQRRVELGTDPIFSSYAWTCSLRIAAVVGDIYSPPEMIARLKAIVEMNPRLPEARYFLANFTARMDARKGLFLAEEAANVAKKAKEAQAVRDQTFYLPTDTRMEWLSLQIAADCAAAIGDKKRARAFAERAMTVGGPRELFEEHLR